MIVFVGDPLELALIGPNGSSDKIISYNLLLDPIMVSKTRNTEIDWASAPDRCVV